MENNKRYEPEVGSGGCDKRIEWDEESDQMISRVVGGGGGSPGVKETVPSTITIKIAPPKEESEQQAPKRKYKGEDLPARAMLALTEALQNEDLASRCKTADTKENVGKAVEQLLTFLAEGQGEDHLILALCCLAFAVEQQEEERYW